MFANIHVIHCMVSMTILLFLGLILELYNLLYIKIIIFSNVEKVQTRWQVAPINC